MKKLSKKGFGRVSRFFKVIYLKLFRINDTPQKIAAGFGVGVFFGVMPGMGPLVSLFFAFVFKINRAAALLGSLLTNTWLSVPVFLLAVKTGALVTGMRYGDIYREWSVFLKDFHWAKLFQSSIYEIIFPVIIGYLIVSFCIGALAYVVTLVIAQYMKRKKSGIFL